MRPFDKISNPRQIRSRLSMNQQEFWARIGVTQSGGSRYESGRKMPKPVRELLRLVHVEGMELASAKRDDLEIIAYLKRNPGSLPQAAQGRGQEEREVVARSRLRGRRPRTLVPLAPAGGQQDRHRVSRRISARC